MNTTKEQIVNTPSETPLVVDQQGSALLDLARILTEKPETDGIRISDLRQQAANELRRYGDDLGSHLRTLAGVQIPPACQLRSAGENRVEVVGEHPQKTEIESFINKDTRLLKWFKELEVLYFILRRYEIRHTGENIDEQIFNLGLTSLGSIAFFTQQV